MLQRHVPAALSDDTRTVGRKTFVLAMPRAEEKGKGEEGRCHELEERYGSVNNIPLLEDKTVPAGRSVSQIASARRPARVAEPNAQIGAPPHSYCLQHGA